MAPIKNRVDAGFDIQGATSSITFAGLVMSNAGAVTEPAINLVDVEDARFSSISLDLNQAVDTDAIRAVRSTVTLSGGTIQNVDGRALSGEAADWNISGVTIDGARRHAIENASGQIDIGESTFTNTGADAIVLRAGDDEHRLRIVDSRIEGVGIIADDSFAIRSSAPWASIVLDEVSFGPRGQGILLAAPDRALAPGNDVCVSLARTSRDPGTELDPEYILDGTVGPVRFEAPTTGVSGNVSRTNVVDVPPGSCAVPGG